MIKQVSKALTVAMVLLKAVLHKTSSLRLQSCLTLSIMLCSNWNTYYTHKKIFSVNTTNTSTYYDATCCCTVLWIILAIATISNQQCHSEEAINDNCIQLSANMLHLLTKTDRPNIIYVMLQNTVTYTIQSCFHTISQNAATAILYCSNCTSFLIVLMFLSRINSARCM
jgi:hypothetical protein